jgi:phosphatidylglycerol---prolipoprotein diacylglyceryl transferase
LLLFATIISSFVFIKQAEASSVKPKTARCVLLILIPAGFLGAHLMYCVFEDREALFQFGGISSFGGLFAGMLVLASMPKLAHQRWRWFDAASYSAVFGALVARTGCFLAHDHMGARTSSLLSVSFGQESRYDLALLELIFLAFLALTLLAVKRQSWSRSRGFTFGLTAFLYGWFRLLVDNLQETSKRYYGFTPEQYASFLLIGIALAGLWNARTNSRSNTNSLDATKRPSNHQFSPSSMR